MNNETALALIDEWWNDDLTCSGEKTCNRPECDLCVKCFERLRNKILKGKI